MRARAVLIVALLFSVSINATLANTPTPTPRPSKQCGFNAYVADVRDEMPDIGDDPLGDRDPAALSPEEWLYIADTFDTVARVLRESDPPDELIEWRDAVVDRYQIIANAARDVSRNGLFSVLIYTESVDKAQAEINRTEAALLITCADFSLTFTETSPTPTPTKTPTPRPTSTPTPVPTFAPIPTPRIPWAN